MVEAGVLDEAAAERHSAPSHHQGVGAQPVLVLDKVTDRLVPDDLFLLCTDGLSKWYQKGESRKSCAAPPLRLVPQV